MVELILLTFLIRPNGLIYKIKKYYFKNNTIYYFAKSVAVIIIAKLSITRILVILKILLTFGMLISLLPRKQ
jgi:hypothetical protein